jgi:hypothetical protein
VDNLFISIILLIFFIGKVTGLHKIKQSACCK